MADEITITTTIKVKHATSGYKFDRTRKFVGDMADTGGGNPGLVSIGTSEENISFGDLTPNYVFIENLDGTNFIEVGKDDSSTMKEMVKLRTGEHIVFPIAASETLRAKADTAAVKCFIAGW